MANWTWHLVSYREREVADRHTDQLPTERGIYMITMLYPEDIRGEYAPALSPYSCSDWDLCRACRARNLRFSRPTESFNWYKPVVLSMSGANCVNSACNQISRSSTVASRLGPGSGGVFSFVWAMAVLSLMGVTSAAAGVTGGSWVMGDWRRASVSSVLNPVDNAAMMMAFFTTVRIAPRYWEKQSSSTMWSSPAKQSVLCTSTGFG